MFHRTSAITTVGLFGATSLLVASGTYARPAENSVHLTGTVRDFLRAHPDFGAAPAAGSGHYAASVAPNIDADGRPALAGTGFKVDTQWLDMHGNPLPPHLYLDPNAHPGGGNGNTVVVQSAPAMSGNSTLDSFDSAAGPYGGSNVGAAPTWDTGNVIPLETPPTGLPYIATHQQSGGTQTLSGSFRCETFNLRNKATLNVQGNVVVVVEDLLLIENRTTVNLETGATLTFWVGNDMEIENRGRINVNTADPTRLHIHHYGPGGDMFKIENNTALYANVTSPRQELLIRNSAELMGVFTGEKLTLSNSGAYHHDDFGSTLVVAPQVCGVDTNDVAGAFGAASTGGIASSTSFAQWYRNVMATNLAVAHTITLVDDGTGVFTYTNSAFYPIDDRLFGNEGMIHNHHFTFEFATTFVHNACNEQFFEFEGADDAWLYIDGKLAMDLGGIAPGTRQYVPIDRLGLTDGETYSIAFFYAQRQEVHAGFKIRTNLPLANTFVPGVASAAFD